MSSSTTADQTAVTSTPTTTESGSGPSAALNNTNTIAITVGVVGTVGLIIIILLALYCIRKTKNRESNIAAAQQIRARRKKFDAETGSIGASSIRTVGKRLPNEPPVLPEIGVLSSSVSINLEATGNKRQSVWYNPSTWFGDSAETFFPPGRKSIAFDLSPNGRPSPSELNGSNPGTPVPYNSEYGSRRPSARNGNITPSTPTTPTTPPTSPPATPVPAPTASPVPPPRNRQTQRRQSNWRQTFMSQVSVGDIISRYRSFYSTKAPESEAGATSTVAEEDENQIVDAYVSPISPSSVADRHRSVYTVNTGIISNYAAGTETDAASSFYAVEEEVDDDYEEDDDVVEPTTPGGSQVRVSFDQRRQQRRKRRQSRAVSAFTDVTNIISPVESKPRSTLSMLSSQDSQGGRISMDVPVDVNAAPPLPVDSEGKIAGVRANGKGKDQELRVDVDDYPHRQSWDSVASSVPSELLELEAKKNGLK
ncbi:hypothetical protein HDU76_006403 [Blyttiomyces sp. JEL0837]|nr:hypothetical protein HDU76_006403 [Blyttiomyces sp. JEL0837]